ncbi:SMP-30/gluconolactonase/LRE family protein [Parahaliea aestuarii]|nr:SMP-30/gluconolactonase/LRE family protein [Parahaliea aestuarii]
MIRMTPGIGLVLLLFAIGAAGAEDGVVPCEGRNGIEPVCGLSAPEDIVAAPDGEGLVFGQMHEPGGLFLLDTADHSVQTLYRSREQDNPEWGEAACSQPPATLLAHGIDLRRRADGRWQLLVVNHGGRESVEFYEWLPGAGGSQVAWRGCVEAPEDASLNDVAGLPDGGFLVTRMASVGSPMWELFLAVIGIDNGVVYRWSPAAGYAELPETEGRFPNGIILSPAGDSFFVNMYFGNKVAKYSLPEGELLGEVSVSKPDNASWNAEGKLLVASQYGSLMQLFDSLNLPHGTPSLLPYAVVEIDPDTLARRELLWHEGAPMGAGTVAVQVDDAVYVGSYTGDRLVRVPLKPAS